MPFGSRNVVIVEDADTMTQRAQNRLLKTLEEPPGNSVIFLLSENIENLVQTIQSRCVKYRLNYFGTSGTDSMLEEASEVVRLLQERAPFYVLKERCDKITRNQGKIRKLFWTVCRWCTETCCFRGTETFPFERR